MMRPIAHDQEDATRELLVVALGNQYQVIRELGRGGMGAVYLAREKALERLVAIKVLKPELAASPDSRERFRREARIVANLSHPGILQLHTFGDVGDVWYFVMSYVRGESLADVLQRRNRIPWTEAHRILVELADALSCAHAYPVVHRDIKPANIMIEAESGRTVLTDFGISKLFGSDDSLTASGAVVGTPRYMSPEQTLARSEVDERSDIYSLGAVAYRMLTGREPFADGTSLQLMYARLTTDPEPVCVVNPDVPEELSATVMKCLAREPEARWQTAALLRDELKEMGERAMDGLPEGVRDIPSYGPYAMIWWMGFTGVAFFTSQTMLDRVLLLLVATLIPVGLFLHIWLMGARDVGAARFIRIALRPPEWWGMYWPVACRRPSDLWSRLPFAGRLSRAALTAFFVIVPGAVLIRKLLGSDTPPFVDSSLVAAELFAAALAGGAVAWGFFWAMQRGLSGAETWRLLIGSTTPSAGWNSPGLGKLLTPPGGRIRTPQPNDAEDYARAVRELAAILPQRYSHLRLTAIDVANDAMNALVHGSAEVTAMESDTPAVEADRLLGRIAALGPVAENESSQRAEMRDLLRSELQLVSRMRDRIVAVAAQRSIRFDRLRNLYEILCEACAEKTEAGAADEVFSGVAAACAELRAELELAVQ